MSILQRFLLLSFLILGSSRLVCADSCLSPTATLTPNATLTGQAISLDEAVDQTEFYYAIHVNANERLHLYTQKDSSNSDSVDTYATLLDSNCEVIEDATVSGTQPRETSINKLLSSEGTYYLRVHGKAAYDGSNAYSSGYFQVKNQIDEALPAHLISIDKTGPSSVESGEVFHYDITISNDGLEDTTALKVVDTLPSTMSYEGFSGTGWSCSESANVVSCTYDTNVLAHSASTSLQISVKAEIVGDDTQDDSTNNSATATASYADSSTKDATDTHSLMIHAEDASIEIFKRAEKDGNTIYQILQGETFNYELQVENTTGNDAINISNVLVVDDVDSAFTVQYPIDADSAIWDCSASSEQHVECALKDDLGNYKSASINVLVKATGSLESKVNNTAIVTAKTPSKILTDTMSIQTDIVGEDIGVVFTKESDTSPVTINNNSIYTFNVTNTSNVPLTSVHVEDTMPSEYLEASSFIDSEEWTCQEPIVDNKIDCTLQGDLGVGQSQDLKVSAKALTIQNSVVNTATVYIDNNISQNASATIDIVDYPSKIETSKSASQIVVLEGDTFSYTIKVKNDGDGNETSVMMEDVIPSELNVTGVSAGADWSCPEGPTFPDTIVCTLNDTLLPHSEASDIIIMVQESADIVNEHSVTNTAEITSAKNSDGEKPTTTVIFRPLKDALSISKTVSEAQVYVDEPFDYTLDIANNARRDITGVHVEDVLPSTLSYVGYDSSNGWSCSFDSNSSLFSCDEGNFSQDSERITLHVTAPSDESNITNHVVMTSDLDALTREDNVTTEVLAKTEKLEFSVHSSDLDPAGIGELFRYTIRVKNVADATENATEAAGVVVVVELDANITYHDMSETSSAWSCTQSGQEVSCTLDSPLAVGAESDPIMIALSCDVEDYTISNLKLTSTKITTPVLSHIDVDVYDTVNTNLAVKIDDSQDPVLAEGTFSYLLDVSNSGSDKVIRDVEVDLDAVSAYGFTYNGVSGDGWSCAQTDKVRCHLDLLAANSHVSLELNVTAPDANTTLEVNANIFSSVVNDSDLSDNSEMEETQVIKYLYDEPNLRPFEKVSIGDSLYTNIHGDIVTIGNQVLCNGGSTGTCTEPNDDVNDKVYQTRINLDTPNAPTYETATKAGFTLSPDDEVIWAGLYWMGMIDRYKGDTDKIEKANKVYLRHDENTTYIPIQSEINKFNWHNDKQDATYVFGYQGVADVTAYVKEHRGGTYWVAGIQTSEGKNLSAGWSLVVVVQDKGVVPTRTLKNLTLFDGFQAVWKNDYYAEATQYPDFVTQHVVGFLTPNYGTINSKVSYFSLEGDKSLKDQISITNKSGTITYLSDSLGDVNDVMNGTVSNPNRAPALSNTSGVDIDTIDVSSIVEHSQIETDITIYSGGDRFYLGMFNFSTNMYLPKICYFEEMRDMYYEPLGERSFALGDPIGFVGYIRNDEDETAKGINLKIEVDNLFQEVNGTLEIQNVSEASFDAHEDYITTTIDDNTTTDDNETVKQTIFEAYVGTGASSSVGGEMNNGDVVNFRYQGVVDNIPDNNRTKNIYKISYEIEQGESTITIPEFEIGTCGDINQTIFVNDNHPKGFGITHQNAYADSDTDFADDNISKNHLFMQLAHSNYLVDVLALDDDGRTGRTHTGEVRLDLVMIDDNASHTCEDYTAISTQYLSFDDMNRVSSLPTSEEAGKKLSYRVYYPTDRYKRYPDWSAGIPLNGLDDETNRARIEAMLEATFGEDDPCKVSCASGSSLDTCRACVYNPDMGIVKEPSCAYDIFAIRPTQIVINANETALVGGKDYTLNFDAGTVGYVGNFSAPKSVITRQLMAPVGCALDDNHTYSRSFVFIDGNASLSNFAYDNIGDIKLSYHDSSWSEYDQNNTDSSMSDCVVGEANNTANVEGKYGCDIYGEGVFSFKPSYFKNEVKLRNDDNNGTYTYLDSDGDKKARAYLTISAMLEDSSVATNYTAGCFAKDISYSFGPSGGISYPLVMKTFEDSGSSMTAVNVFATTEGDFTNGVAKPIVGINFARTKTGAINPFEVNASDLFIMTIDDDSVSGTSFTTTDGNAVYYYGRIYAPDYLSIEPSTFNAKLFYEVYCDDGCDKAYFGLDGLQESPDYVEWVVNNTQHVYSTSDYSSLVSTNGLGVSSLGMVITLNLGTKARPYCDKVSLIPAGWLKYSKYSSIQADKLSFKACFNSRGTWAGKGDVGMTVDSNVSKDKNTKIDW